MTRDLASTDHHDLPLDQGDRAEAANNALFAGKETLQQARESWDLIRETFGDQGVALEEQAPAERTARCIAVRLEQSARRFFGLVSSAAGGIWGVDEYGRIAQIEDTSGGSDYFDGVRFHASADLDDLDSKVWDVPVKDFVAFFETFEQANEWLNPTPRHGLFG